MGRVKGGGAQTELWIHLHQKSTCWKLLGMRRSRFPFNFLGSTSMAEESGLLVLQGKQAKMPSKRKWLVAAEPQLSCPPGQGN